MIQASEQILLMAFRYALNRKTGAVTEVVRELQRHWDNLPQWMREQIISDILRQQKLSHESIRPGVHDYADEWNAILDRGRDGHKN